MPDERITSWQPIAASSGNDAEWHAIHAGKELGPLSLAELVEKAVAGEIEPDDLVKNADGLWAKARDIDFLQQLFRLRESRGKASQPAPYRSGRETKALGGGLLLVLVGAACIWGICTLIDSARSRFSNNDRSWNAKIEKNDPGWNAKFYADRGWDSIKKKDYDAAIRDSSEAIRLDPNYAAAYYYRGIAYGIMKVHDKAIADYTEAIRLGPNFAPAYSNRGLAFNNKKEYDQAIVDYTEAIRLDPNYAKAYFNRGCVYGINKKEYDQAIADYTEAIRLRPNDALAYSNRYLAYLARGDRDLAWADYQRVTELDPALARRLPRFRSSY
jgi:tetratricopeptide (TPR) repeat protein